MLLPGLLSVHAQQDYKVDLKIDRMLLFCFYHLKINNIEMTPNIHNQKQPQSSRRQNELRLPHDGTIQNMY